jgi:hypothetical protein
MLFADSSLGDTGLEHTPKTPVKPQISKRRGTESGTVHGELAQILAAWATLPEAVKGGILAMVKASQNTRQGGR